MTETRTCSDRSPRHQDDPSGRSVPQLLEQLALAIGEVGRGDDARAGQQIAAFALAASQLGHALPAQSEAAAALRFGGNRQGDFAGRGRHLDLAAEDGGRDRNVDVGPQIVAVALEAAVGSDGDDEVDVARRAAVQARSALAGHAHALAGVDTGRDVDLERLGAAHEAGAVAGRALLTAHFAGAAAGRAGLRDLQLNLPGGPAERLVERDLDRNLGVLAALRSGPCLRSGFGSR